MLLVPLVLSGALVAVSLVSPLAIHGGKGICFHAGIADSAGLPHGLSQFRNGYGTYYSFRWGRQAYQMLWASDWSDVRLSLHHDVVY